LISFLCCSNEPCEKPRRRLTDKLNTLTSFLLKNNTLFENNARKRL
jgi:hypothetical protein